MEILQTIWTALTTENEGLLNILLVLFGIIEAYLIAIIILLVLNITHTHKQKYLYVLLYYAISMTTMLFIPSPWYTFINAFCIMILVFAIFKVSLLKSVLATIVSYIISLILNTVILIFYTSALNIPSHLMKVIPLYRISACLLYFILLYTTYKLYKKYKLSFNISDKLKTTRAFILTINLSVGILVIALQAYIEMLYIDYIPNFLVYLSLCVLSFYFIINLYSLIRTNKLEVTTQNLEEQKLYNKTLTILHDSIRSFKHDFSNIVQAIGGYVATDNIEGLKNYYDDLLEDCQKTNNLSVLNPEIINNPAIYSLLASKYYKADDAGIKINLEVFCDLNNLKIKTYDLTRILGVLLDNAIEASSKCTEKVINIIFRTDSKKNRDLIIIENTYENKEIDTEKIFEKGYTSKTEDLKSHGLGLWEVRKFLHKYSNLNLYTTKTEKYFKQQFELYI